MSVAIRTATRIVDQDDFGSTPGAGSDGYAVVWDNGSGTFVLAAAGGGGVTDHGALTGLSDDDHAQYALLAGRSGGQTLYGGTGANDDITIHGTSNATRTTSYVILQPTAGNVGIGTATPSAKLDVLGKIIVANGYNSTFITGGNTTATGTNNVAIGASAGASLTSGVQNMLFGANAGYGLSSGNNNLCIGQAAGYTLTTQGQNVILGSEAGFFATGSTCVFIGYRAGYGETASNRLHIANTATATPLVYGEFDTGIVKLFCADAATSSIVNGLTLEHVTSGTAAAGFGGGLAFNLQSSTTASQSAALMTASWIVATHASRTARLALSAYDYNGAREGVRIDTDGSAALLGFYGHAATAQQVLATGAGATVDDVISKLQALGLVKQS